MDAVAFMEHPELLGRVFAEPSWATWKAVLRATFALPMTDAERAVFAEVAGGRAPPSRRVRRLVLKVGRRSGKSIVMAALGAYAATMRDWSRRLAPGERAIVMAVARDREQAEVVHAYARELILGTPALAALVTAERSDEIELGPVTLGIYTADAAAVRGRTVVAFLGDEVAFWRRGVDRELLRAVEPATATVGEDAIVVLASSPHMRRGVLADEFARHYGQDSDVLVVSGPSLRFNPSLPAATIDRALTDDPEAARAEWLGEFRQDLTAFLSVDLVEAAVDRDRPLELPPDPTTEYVAHADPSGGRHDRFGLAIGHREGERVVVDVARLWHAPFNPHAVTGEVAELLAMYRVHRVVGDRYSASWCETAFRERGVAYVAADRPASELFVDALPAFTRGLVSLPDHRGLLDELAGLERRVRPGGRDQVSHGPGGHDDAAVCVAGLAARLNRPANVFDARDAVFGPGYAAANPGSPWHSGTPERTVDRDGNTIHGLFDADHEGSITDASDSPWTF